MPLKKDPAGGGTNADGSRSTEYCSRCYQQGRFTSPNMTCDEMVVLVKGKMKEMGIPSFMGWFFTRNIPRLKRWRT